MATACSSASITPTAIQGRMAMAAASTAMGHIRRTASAAVMRGMAAPTGTARTCTAPVASRAAVAIRAIPATRAIGVAGAAAGAATAARAVRWAGATCACCCWR